ncbi:MAG: TonB-dependent receptor [uncultured Aureispira sp.]|uniref:TonB-dependent receptor n=1 Tax=uncultured Aureispira sp. TaxID=1331704 RepID=A0A6S6U3S8_9BACT|nr:MAG: TonB-dependent receptor [uncultured Aureispira sp.]
MKQLLLLLVFILTSSASIAQSLGEDVYIRYYLGRSIQRTKLFDETGIGKFIAFRNIPSNWILEYQRTNALEDIQGLFGAVKPNFSFLNNKSFLLDFKGSSLGELDFSFRGKMDFKKVIGELNVNGHWGNQRNDSNQDNYLDLDLKKRIFLHNSWSFFLKNFTSVNTIWFLGMETQGGQLNFNKASDYLTNNAYGNGIGVTHFVGESSNFIATRSKDMLLINFRVVDHTQNNYYGLQAYTGKEWSVDAKAQYSYRLDNGFDLFQFGLNYRYQTIRESLDSLDLERKESFGGGYVGYETFFGKKFKLSTRVNVAYHNLASWIFVPHLRLDATLLKSLSATAFGGSGMRYANVLSENAQFLLSNRSVKIEEALLPERAWYYGASVNYGTWLKLGLDFYTSLNVQVYHTIYQNKIILDLDSDAYAMSFHNQDGKAEKLSFELDAQIRLAKPQIGLNIDYRLDFIHSTINNQYVREPLSSMHNLLLALDYRLMIQNVYICDITSQFHWYGPQRLPNVSVKTGGGFSYPLESPSVSRWDLKLSFPFYAWVKRSTKWKNFIFYAGIDNLLNEVQPLSYINGEQPFDQNFDGGLFWNSTLGRRYYGGFTYVF